MEAPARSGWWAWLLASLGAFGLGGGCVAEGTFEDYCERVCRCDDACSQAQLEQCQRFGRDWEALAVERGCDEELSHYFGCYNAHLICRGGQAVLDDEGEACRDEDAALPAECNPFATPE